MSISDGLLPHYDQEIGRTRRLLESVPEDKFAWSPHDKSMSLGELASHLAAVLAWAPTIIEQDEFDVAPPGSEGSYSPTTYETLTDILNAFDKNAGNAREMLAAKSDEEYMAPWSLKKGGEVLFTAPRVGVVQDMLIHHLIHHRGQMSVYLRMCDVPVPQTYGPTADFPDF